MRRPWLLRLVLAAGISLAVLVQGAIPAFGAAVPPSDPSAEAAEAVFFLGLAHSNLEASQFFLGVWESQVLARLAQIHQLEVQQAALQSVAAAAHTKAVNIVLRQYMEAPVSSSALSNPSPREGSRPLVTAEYNGIATSLFEAQQAQEDAQAASASAQVKAIDAQIAQSQLQGLVTVNAALKAEQSFDAARAQVAALASAQGTAAPTVSPLLSPTTTSTSTTTTSTTTTTTTPPTTSTDPGHRTKTTTPGTTSSTTTSTTTTTAPASAAIPSSPPETTFAPDNPVVLPTETADLQGLSILGPEVLTAAQIAGWFRSVSDKNITGATPLQLAELYLDEGAAEGVRGDIAFAQAMVETGGFSITNGTDNFAGIGACDSCAHGYSFPSVRMGVRAQIELLKAYADPFFTEETTARPPVYKGIDTLSVHGKEPTWDSLSGVWSSGKSYGQDVLALYQSMVTWALAHPQG